jgi:molecular chaperone GrpE
MDNTETNTEAPAAELPELTTAKAEIEAIRKQLAEAEAKAKENLDGWQRERAGFSNFRQRQEREMLSLRSMAATGLIGKLLPVIDDFERAARNMPADLKGNTYLDGIMLIQRKLTAILESEGVKPVDAAANDAFNPAQHEAISHDDAPEGVQSGNVIEQLQRGYMLEDKVLRPALVRVAR